MSKELKDIVEQGAAAAKLDADLNELSARIMGVTPEEAQKHFDGDGADRSPGAPPGCPFAPAAPAGGRVKILTWGPSGAGKTWLALQFPRPVVIDMERGTEQYGGRVPFDVKRTTDASEVMRLLEWLMTNRHPYQTLVIDPVTVFWESLQKKWSDIFLERNKASKGFKHEFYDLQPKDWNTLKSEHKEFIRNLHALDMNVIATCRSKTLYDGAEFMKKAGETFDGERSLAYHFDVVIQLWTSDGDGKYWAKATKDRTQRLPREPFPSSYETIRAAFADSLAERSSEPIAMATEDQIGEIYLLRDALAIPSDLFAERLKAYGAGAVSELTATNAVIILEKLRLAAKK